MANSTLARGGNTTGLEVNGTDGESPEREFPFMEDRSKTEFIEIPNLQPFTVYRIDIHACNQEVHRCSAGAFVFSRTKPAGEAVTHTDTDNVRHKGFNNNSLTMAICIALLF